MKGEVIDRIIKTFEEQDEFALVLHQNPDGDCIGSAAFLYHFLTKRLNKNVYIVCDRLGKENIFITQKMKKFHTMYDLDCDIKLHFKPGENAYFVVLDHHDLNNSSFKEGISSEKLIVLDHHYRIDDFTPHENALWLIDEKKKSTCSILHGLFRLKYKYDKTEALFLHLGMGSDNLNCKRPLGICEVRQIAELAEIIDKGAGISYNQLTSLNYDTKSGAQFTVECDIYNQKTFFRDRGTRGTSVCLVPSALKGIPSALIAQTFLQFPDTGTMSFLFHHARIKTLRIYTRDRRLVDFLSLSGIEPTCTNYYYKKFDPHEDGLGYLRDLKQGFKDYLASL